MADRLAEIEARLSKATPGPWTHYAPPFVRIVAPEIPPDVQRMVGPDPHNPLRAFGDRICEVESEGFDDEANAALIAAAPTDLRDLLAVAKAARDVPVQHEGRCAILIQAHYREDAQASGVFTTAALPACDCRLRDFNAALADLEGGA